MTYDMKKHFSIIIFISLTLLIINIPALAETKTFIKEYKYQAGDGLQLH
jgi:hypothetical protein